MVNFSSHGQNIDEVSGIGCREHALIQRWGRVVDQSMFRNFPWDSPGFLGKVGMGRDGMGWDSLRLSVFILENGVLQS